MFERYNNYYEHRSDERMEQRRNVFPENPMYGQSYVPIQYMSKTFKPEVGLKMGTIFPELVSPYTPGQSMKEIEYLARNNREKEDYK